MQKGKPVVVILDVQGPAHPAGVLAHETEIAVVLAGDDFIRFQNNSQALVIVLLDFEENFFPGGFLNQQLKLFAGALKAQVQKVVNDPPVDGNQFIPAGKAQFGGYRFWLNFPNFHPTFRSKLSTFLSTAPAGGRPFRVGLIFIKN